MNFVEIETRENKLLRNPALRESGWILVDLRSFIMDVELNQLGICFINLTLLASICSNIAMSAISERQRLGVQIVYTFMMSVVILPVVTQWTFGRGFL